MKEIAIIGGGFSGTLTAVQLLRQARMPLHVTLYEKRPERVGKGLAYSTTESCHLLNVPAKGMSALPDQPDHFLRWAESLQRSGALTGVDVHADAFLPRTLYGRYVEALLHDTIRTQAGRHRYSLVPQEVLDLKETGREASFWLDDGQRAQASRVVLALGNFPPADPLAADGKHWYHPTPWDENLAERVLASSSCVIIGSGLTMLDVVLMLHDRQYAGTLHVVSRRGLLPQPHQPGCPPPDGAVLPKGSPLPALVRTIRQIAARHQQAGGHWQGVMDWLRPHNAELWRGLSLNERRAFVRHVRRYWENHRHRAAPAVHARFHRLVQTGRVVLHRGRVGAMTPAPHGVELQLRGPSGGVDILRADHVINCTGAECDYRKVPNSLVRHLLERRLTCCDPLGFGIMASDEGALIDADGNASHTLFTIGPPMKGALWETTAVPELRVQAHALAARLLRD